MISAFEIAIGGLAPTEDTRRDCPDRFDAETPASQNP